MTCRALVVSLFAVASAPAQNALPSPLKVGDITVTGSVRSRVYSWDWFQADSGDGSYAYSGTLLRVALSQSHETWDWTAEFAAPILLGLPDDANGPGTQGALG